MYDGANLIEEADGAGNLAARYVFGSGIDEPLGVYRGATWEFYQADGLGSVTSLSTSVGTVSDSFVYDSFGNVTSSTGTFTQPFRYTGREWDAETGLYYYRARYYDASTGRFLSEDPAGSIGSENIYAYTGNNPLNWIDPSGLRMTPAQCKEIRKQIKRLSIKLAKELVKYNPIADGKGRSRMKWGKKLTSPGGHYEEMGNYATGIINNVVLYYKECRGCDNDRNINPRIPELVLEPVREFNRAPKPVLIPFQIYRPPVDIPEPEILGGPGPIPVGGTLAEWLSFVARVIATAE